MKHRRQLFKKKLFAKQVESIYTPTKNTREFLSIYNSLTCSTVWLLQVGITWQLILVFILIFAKVGILVKILAIQVFCWLLGLTHTSFNKDCFPYWFLGILFQILQICQYIFCKFMTFLSTSFLGSLMNTSFQFLYKIDESFPAAFII